LYRNVENRPEEKIFGANKKKTDKEKHKQKKKKKQTK